MLSKCSISAASRPIRLILGRDKFPRLLLDACRGNAVEIASNHPETERPQNFDFHTGYVALGPVFGTTSKEIAFTARGTDRVADWRRLVPADTPLVAIGGINLGNAASVVAAGADSIAVISALPEPVGALEAAVREWEALWRRGDSSS